MTGPDRAHFAFADVTSGERWTIAPNDGWLPWWVLGAAIGVNLLTFLVYAMDKSAAQNGQWRTKESHLHLLSLAGGWPGAWFAQQWLRHKSRKTEFRAVYWATVVLHCAAVVAWLGGWLRGL